MCSVLICRSVPWVGGCVQVVAGWRLATTVLVLLTQIVAARSREWYEPMARQQNSSMDGTTDQSRDTNACPEREDCMYEVQVHGKFDEQVLAGPVSEDYALSIPVLVGYRVNRDRGAGGACKLLDGNTCRSMDGMVER